ncbi:MAG: PadR family transcriptional regulator [Methanobrevibacter sp.]|uniref:PadR family transcriptional regulator n=1 Tax=Methanobrevibacter sp. TaxID=66852 RepID=UPI0025D0A700|nr:PadR family transcriptional regulator [Methanobrevibacter sp.]MBQ6099081.1 PadR family transcriptional regulator [Methanobrevibacter sp.]
MKYFTNAFTHNLILWIISKETIHGYGIMKKLDEFFKSDEDFKNTSSKIYPLLRKMERNGLIKGEWRINENNKRVKYYSITEDGETVLLLIREKFNKFQNNPQWIEFMNDISDRSKDNEERN